ncbi:MAG TPA: hypothetical protein VKU39_13515 [Streptosporangiaceae bacterium]|nr:hypothetical protein [Streptosporangiaceae bacterium]
MTWGLVIALVAIVVAWRRPRLDAGAVAWLLVATAGILAYTYRSLGS